MEFNFKRGLIGPDVPQIKIRDNFAKTIQDGDLVPPSQPCPEVPAKSPSRFTKPYSCRTQAKSSLNSEQSLIIGTGGKVEIWESKSVIKFVVYGTSFPKPNDAAYAGHQLNAGAQMWNDVNIGVTLKWVSNIDEATFVLVYGGEDGNTLARAFFPNKKDLNIMYVYSRAFDDDAIEHQSNIFAHEIGHALGLRHEFAIEKEKRDKAVIFEDANPLSVMSYEFPPRIQPSDIKNTRKLYETPNGANIEGFPVFRYIPG